ncbi:MAG: cation/cationic drug transporter [Acidobacteriia bacterium]|nr:cation/cationic drug transporter [Terriglobia bacterium]
MSTVAVSPVREADSSSRRRSIGLVFCCTILGAAAQILLKTGANQLTHPSLLAVFSNLPLFSGLALYGVSTVLLVLALRDGELSMLYPVIALTYVWVTALSLVIFHDRVSPGKLAGIAIIVLGVGVLGRGRNK